MTIPRLQEGAEVVNPGKDYKIALRNDIPVPDPGSNEVLVKLTCTGLW
jgi:propanol-preferring alcohol dehydrogenase